MSFKKIYSLALCAILMQANAVSFAADKNTLNVNDNKTSIKTFFKLEKDPSVNLNLSDAKVGDVLKALTDQIGYNLVISASTAALDESIPRIEFNNMKLSEAFSFILRIKNLAAKKVGRTIIVGDKDKINTIGIDDSIVKSYKVANLKPSTAVEKIKEFYKDPNVPPTMIPGDGTNSLSAIIKPYDLDFFESVLSIVDTAVPQVMIEIKLIELSENDARQLSFGYGLGQKQGAFGFNNNAAGATGGAGAGGAVAGVAATGVKSSGVVLSFDALKNFTANFNAELNALVQNNKAKILSNPRIATQSGKEARFTSTETVPVIKTAASAAGVTQSVEQFPIGETINVTPLLVDPSTGYITLDLRPSISSRGKDVIVNNNPVPETLTRTLNTTMKVKSGDSIIIGGLKRKNSSNASNRIPILGDIPIIGTLFSSNSWTQTESELIIMVTPYLLDESGNVPGGNSSSKIQ